MRVLRPDPQAAGGDTSKPTPSDSFPPTRPHLLHLLSWCPPSDDRAFKYESVGDIRTAKPPQQVTLSHHISELICIILVYSNSKYSEQTLLSQNISVYIPSVCLKLLSEVRSAKIKVFLDGPLCTPLYWCFKNLVGGF